MIGSAGDTIIGGSGPDVISGAAGTMSITGGSGATTVFGGTGDTITGGTGTTVIVSPGEERISGGSGSTTIWGGAGDTISGGSGIAAIIGAANSTITAGSGTDLINGSVGSQSITGGTGATTVFGGAGDTITGGVGTTVIVSPGEESLAGGSGATTIWGGAGDTISGSTGSGTATIVGTVISTITGGSGTDLIDATAGSQCDHRGQRHDGGVGRRRRYGRRRAGNLYVAINHAFFGGAVLVGDIGAGDDTVTGFSQSAGDRIFFPNETTAAINSLVATAQSSNGNTLITFADGGTMTLDRHHQDRQHLLWLTKFACREPEDKSNRAPPCGVEAAIRRYAGRIDEPPVIQAGPAPQPASKMRSH